MGRVDSYRHVAQTLITKAIAQNHKTIIALIEAPQDPIDATSLVHPCATHIRHCCIIGIMLYEDQGLITPSKALYDIIRPYKASWSIISHITRLSNMFSQRSSRDQGYGR